VMQAAGSILQVVISRLGAPTFSVFRNQRAGNRKGFARKKFRVKVDGRPQITMLVANVVSASTHLVSRCAEGAATDPRRVQSNENCRGEQMQRMMITVYSPKTNRQWGGPDFEER
jgi:hypothetical protein